MKNQFKKKSLLLIMVLISFSVNAKNDNMLGIYSFYSNSSTLNRFVYGISIENKLTNYLGVNYGIALVNKTEGSLYKFYSLPVSLKLYTKIVHVSLGANVDLLYKELADANIPSYHYGVFDFGVFGKIGKEIKIINNFYIEPEITLGYMGVLSEYVYLGGGIIAKILF